MNQGSPGLDHFPNPKEQVQVPPTPDGRTMCYPRTLENSSGFSPDTKGQSTLCIPILGAGSNSTLSRVGLLVPQITKGNL
jgi:hypothetical protein